MVAPDEGGAEYGAFGIEDDEAVHLSGEGDAFDGAAGLLGEDAVDGGGGGAPPIVRALLGPEGLGHGHFFMGDGLRGHDGTCRVDEKGAGAAGADVNSEPVSHGRLAGVEGLILEG